MTLTFESGMSVVRHNFLGKGCDCLIEDKYNIFEEGDMSGDGMAMTGGCPRTPDWMASGRQVNVPRAEAGMVAASAGSGLVCPFGIVVEPYQSDPTTRALLVPLEN